MLKFILLLSISMILAISCQKDAGNKTLSRISSADSSLLIKKVDESSDPGVPGKSIATAEYQYDTQRKLIRLLVNTALGEKSIRSESLYARDNLGRISDIEIKSQRLLNNLPYTTLEGPAFDTSVTKVVYQDATTKKINYLKRIDRAGKNTAIDSIVYGYDNNNHVNRTTYYYLPWAIRQPGDSLMMTRYTTWTFTEKGSLAQAEEYGKNNGNFTLQIRYHYEYDNKINPLFRNEDIFLEQWSDFSTNNVVKGNVYIPATGENYNNTALYVYSIDNKPISVTYFSPVVFSSRQSTFYYQ